MGRPLKHATPEDSKIFGVIVDTSHNDKVQLSLKIAAMLGGHCSNSLTDELAHIATNHLVVVEIQKNAPLLVKRQGRRKKIDLSSLLADCARFNEQLTGNCAISALKSIGGWREEETEANPEKIPQILKFAEAILCALDVKHGSLRGQAQKAAQRHFE